MATKKVKPLLYKLDDIYNKNRKEQRNYAGKILMAVIHDFCEYWRELEDNDFKGLEKHETDELYFFFNEKLVNIARTHLDLYWLMMDYDEGQLYSDGREPEPFWRNPGSRKRRLKKHALTGKLNSHSGS
jgi:hypothetical protein